ncbi:unnamed protein product [Knipowitschia caucasica]
MGGQSKVDTEDNTAIPNDKQSTVSNAGDLWETRSNCLTVSRASQRSRTSQWSNASALAARARAKAAAAQAQVSYAEGEAEVIKQQAHIEAEATKRKAILSADLLKLRLQSAAAAANAEAEVLEAAAGDEDGDTRLPTERNDIFQPRPDPSPPPPGNTRFDSSQTNTLVLPTAQQVKNSGEFVQSKAKEHSIQSRENSEYEFQELPVVQSPRYRNIIAADRFVAQSCPSKQND